MASPPQGRPLARRRFVFGAATTAIGILAAACGTAVGTPASSPPTATTAAAALPQAVAPAAPPATPTPCPVIATLPPTAPATPVATMPLIVFVGSSMTNGVGATGGNTYPKQTLDLLKPTTYDTKIVAGNGRSIAFIRDFAPTAIGPAYTPTRRKNIVVLETDLTRGVGAEQDYADTVGFCTTRKAVGWNVIVCTILPRRGSYSWPAFDADRLTLNGNLRNNWRGFADALADLAADPQLGNDGAPADPRYFNADQTHPTDAGYAIMAAILRAAILAL